MEESIYNLIPRQYKPDPKTPLYRSKYPPNIPPTGSTFCHYTTSKPGVANLSGQFAPGLQAHTEYGNRSTLGYLKHDRKPSPDLFRRKGTGTMGSNLLPPVRNFSYDCSHKRPPVPSVHDKPVLGQRSGKDFIVSNAIENILSTAKRSAAPVDYLSKKDFGKVPEYLNRIKGSIQQEYKMIQTLHQQQQENKYGCDRQVRQLLSQQQVSQIREGLKRKWDEVNREYQKLTHIKLVDTVGLKRKKEGFEKQLKQIEDDIKKLNKTYIFVE